MGPPDVPASIQQARVDLSERLGRTSCEGCPSSWELIDCDFSTSFSRLGGGSQASHCRRLKPFDPDHEIPEEIEAIAVSRVGEAIRSATEDPHEWLVIYIMGYDLFRSGHPITVSVGQDAQALALRNLDRLPRSEDWNWPSELAVFLSEAVDLRHVLDLALLDASFDPLIGKPARTTLLLEVFQQSPSSSSSTTASIKEAISRLDGLGTGRFSFPELVDRAASIETQSWSLATRRAVSDFYETTGRCPADTSSLVPDYLPSLPGSLHPEDLICPDSTR